MIEQLNRRITFRRFLFGQDESGGSIKQAQFTWTVWASVELINGDRNSDNGQVQYPETYRIKKRYESSRPVYSQDEIIYEGSVFNIHSIKEDSEGKKRFNIIQATTTGSSVSISTELNSAIDMVHYEATGGEYSFQDDQLLSKTLLLIFRDGIEYSAITTGTPTGKKVLYDSSAGTLEFDNNVLPLAPEEVVDVYILR